MTPRALKTAEATKAKELRTPIRVDQPQHGLPAQIRPPSDRLASILRVLPAAFLGFHDMNALKVP